jgi:HEAT repeat protein
VRAALKETDPEVLKQAARAVEMLYFQHAFDPLSRIVREAPQPPIRAAALSALARVDTVEAAEFMLGVLEHGAPGDRAAALDSLKRTKGMKFVDLARTEMTQVAPPVQQALRDVLRARGISA